MIDFIAFLYVPKVLSFSSTAITVQTVGKIIFSIDPKKNVSSIFRISSVENKYNNLWYSLGKNNKTKNLSQLKSPAFPVIHFAHDYAYHWLFLFLYTYLFHETNRCFRIITKNGTNYLHLGKAQNRTAQKLWSDYREMSFQLVTVCRPVNCKIYWQRNRIP